MSVRPYIVSCAGCNERYEIADIDALSAWMMAHRCWEQRPTALALSIMQHRAERFTEAG